MSTPTLGPGTFTQAYQRVQELIAEVISTAQEIIAGINSVLNWLPGFIADRIRPLVETFLSLLQRFLAEVAKFFTEPGWPPALFSASQAWTQIGATTSGLVATMTLDQKHADDSWTGAAATAYKNHLPTQKAALEAVKEAGDEVSDALIKTMFAIISFWVAIALVIAALVVELTAETVAAATPAAPAAAAAAGVSSAKAITLTGAAVTALIAYLSVVSGQANDLEQRLANNNAFPRGAWPIATTGMSDGSISDGDGTDWSLPS